MLPLPKPDGAPFRCSLWVNVPAPYFYDSCGEKAIGFVMKPSGGKALRCENHREITVDFLEQF